MFSFSTIVVLDLHDQHRRRPGDPGDVRHDAGAGGADRRFLVGYVRLNSLIVTLGMLSAIQGLTLVYSGGQNMDIDDKEGTWFASSGRVI